jgi:hypothetical protein
VRQAHETQGIEDVLAREREYIRRRRRHAPVGSRNVENTLVGLALSGGGIRSATTNLGILQALSRMKILPLVDYICTVSGGGYIGACLSSLLSLPDSSAHNPGAANGAPLFSTEWASFPFNPEHREGRAQIDHLRTHGSFLVTRTGLFVRETMRSIGFLLSSTSYNLGMALLTLLVIAWLYMGIILRVSPDLHATLSPATPMSRLVDDPAYDKAAPRDDERKIFRRPTLGESLAHKGQLVRASVQDAKSKSAGRRGMAGAMLFGIAIALSSFFYLFWQSKQRNRRPGNPRAGESARDARERKLLRLVGVGGVLATLTAFVASRVLCAQQGKYLGVLWLFVPASCLAAVWFTSFLLQLILPRLTDVWNRGMRSLWGAYQAMASYAFWIALVFALFPLATYSVHEQWHYVGLSGVLSLVLARVATTRVNPSSGHWTVTADLQRWLLGLFIVAGLLLLLVAITAHLVPPAPDVDTRQASNTLFAFAAAGAVLLFALGWIIDANRVSPHYFYQDRLGETYLFTEKREPDGSLATARNSTRLRLCDLHGPAAAQDDPTRLGTAPYHLISTAINLASSRDLTRKNRKSGYFVLSKYHCGSTQTRFCRTEDYQLGQTSVARAMTISGAAASSGIGAGTFFAQAFATVLFNLRLGYWMPNPRSEDSAKPGDGWHFWPWWLGREMFTQTDEIAKLVNLSDGGHTGDNVGIYPLLQRRCRVIIACDAERDSDLTFGSITEALRHAYIDLGIDVDIDFTMVRPDPATGMSRSHCAVGLIRYPPRDRFVSQERLPDMAAGESAEPPLIGYLIYLKNSLTGDEPEPVLNYKSSHPEFPHETTVDQFFDDAQFESYRALGVHIAEHVLAPWAASPAFEALRREYWPFSVPLPPPEPPPAPTQPPGADPNVIQEIA